MENRRLDISIEEWMEDYKKGSVKALTYDRLVVSHKLLKGSHISLKPVDTINSRDLQRYLNDLAAYGYSQSTIKKQLSLITSYWKWALSEGLVEKPIYLNVKMPRVASNENDISFYTASEQRKMLVKLRTLEKPQYLAAILMLECGMRIGEVLALEWDDILVGKCAIKINKTLIRTSSHAETYVQDSPKSRNSRRTIPMSDEAWEAFLRYRGLYYNDSRWIFAAKNDPSKPCSYSSVEFHIRKLCKDLDIPYRGLHAFRHTFATNCYERGCDVKILSKMLGHADVSVTYNVYIHLYGDALEEMRKAIGGSAQKM